VSGHCVKPTGRGGLVRTATTWIAALVATAGFSAWAFSAIYSWSDGEMGVRPRRDWPSTSGERLGASTIPVRIGSLERARDRVRDRAETLRNRTRHTVRREAAGSRPGRGSMVASGCFALSVRYEMCGERAWGGGVGR